MPHLIRRFRDDNTGATAMEYGLIAAGIALAIIATVNLMGGQLGANFQAATAALDNSEVHSIGSASDK